MPPHRLQKDVFIALAAIAWADGQLDPDEADAIVRAAVDEGLDLDEIADVEEATKSPVSLGAINRDALTKVERVFVYAVACWIATLDGDMSASEQKALANLGDRLDVPERPRAIAERIARQVAELPAGNRPDRYDLAKVKALIAERLSGGKS